MRFTGQALTVAVPLFPWPGMYHAPGCSYGEGLIQALNWECVLELPFRTFVNLYSMCVIEKKKKRQLLFKNHKGNRRRVNPVKETFGSLSS